MTLFAVHAGSRPDMLLPLHVQASLLLWLSAGVAQSTYNLPSTFRTQAITVAQALQMSVQPDAKLPLQEATIASLQQGMRAGNHTCSSVVNAYLQVTVQSHP